MKPNKKPRWANPQKPETKKATVSVEDSEKKEALRRKKEGAEMCRRRKAMRRPGQPDVSLTQGDLAELIQVQRNTITRWEVGRLEIPKWAWVSFDLIEKDLKQKIDSAT